MGYKHGTYQQEGATAFQLPVVLDYGHFIVGTAPIHKVKAENRKVNEVIRISKCSLNCMQLHHFT